MNDSALNKYLITDDQWNEFTKIQNFLKPFKEVTTIMSSSSYPTLSTTIPLYNILIDHLEDIIGDNETEDNDNNNTNTENDNTEDNSNKDEKWSQLIVEAAKKCKEKLIEYYNKTNDSYLISVILDPRLKLIYFQDNNWEDELVIKIQKMLVYYYFKFYYYL